MKRRKHVFLWTVSIVFAARSQNKTSGNYDVTTRVMIFVWVVDAEKVCHVVVEKRSRPKNNKIKKYLFICWRGADEKCLFIPRISKTVCKSIKVYWFLSAWERLQDHPTVMLHLSKLRWETNEPRGPVLPFKQFVAKIKLNFLVCAQLVKCMWTLSVDMTACGQRPKKFVVNQRQ